MNVSREALLERLPSDGVMGELQATPTSYTLMLVTGVLVYVCLLVALVYAASLFVLAAFHALMAGASANWLWAAKWFGLSVAIFGFAAAPVWIGVKLATLEVE